MRRSYSSLAQPAQSRAANYRSATSAPGRTARRRGHGRAGTLARPRPPSHRRAIRQWISICRGCRSTSFCFGIWITIDAVATLGANALFVRVLRQCETSRKRAIEALDAVHLLGFVPLLLLALAREREHAVLDGDVHVFLAHFGQFSLDDVFAVRLAHVRHRRPFFRLLAFARGAAASDASSRRRSARTHRPRRGKVPI